jgi:hypothetical protein
MGEFCLLHLKPQSGLKHPHCFTLLQQTKKEGKIQQYQPEALLQSTCFSSSSNYCKQAEAKHPSS